MRCGPYEARIASASRESSVPLMFSAAYARTNGSGSPDVFAFAIASAKAAMISAVVATHSNGFTSKPASSRRIGIVASLSKRSPPNIFISTDRGTNGYMVRNTDTHFGQRPHQESERFRLQLLKRSKNAGKL